MGGRFFNGFLLRVGILSGIDGGDWFAVFSTRQHFGLYLLGGQPFKTTFLESFRCREDVVICAVVGQCENEHFHKRAWGVRKVGLMERRHRGVDLLQGDAAPQGGWLAQERT